MKSNFTAVYACVAFVLLSVQVCIGQNEKAREDVDSLLTNWHRAAASAHFEDYFSKMAQDAVYIGTAPEEHWTKDEFKAFAKPYFRKGQTWDFEAIKRSVNFSDRAQLAWFDELLETWMGVARGSGVLVKNDGEWKIKQYVLSFTIPNSKSEAVVELKRKDDQSILKKFRKK